MAAFKDLPIEILGIILKNLDSIESLDHAAITCRMFNSALKEASGVEFAIIRNNIPYELLPPALALASAERGPHGLFTHIGARKAILQDLYNQPSVFLDRLKALGRHDIRLMCRKLVARHNIIKQWAADLASNAWKHVARLLPEEQRILDLSPTEHVRNCRAFYRVELWHKLFYPGPPDGRLSFQYPVWFEDNEYFFAPCPPWEIEQLCCIYQFLDLKLTEGTSEVVAHDVVFGHMAMGYYR
ncbi:hypothetical protein GE09DRAFT_345103 [Coniochaeta sp. 2T2.1]|nr:hypothetical protein GE09DRAFT_345103 [Coniochaeta sp. 2T2.1]